MATDSAQVSGLSWLGQQVLAASIAPIIPATILVALRIWARLKGQAGIREDDWCILIAMAAVWALCGLRISLVTHGLGYHVWELPPAKVERFTKLFLAVQQAYYLSTTATKISILLLYRRIFGIYRPFKIAVYIVTFFDLAFFFICVFTSIFGCTPVSYFWNKHQPGHCINETDWFHWSAISNVILDIITLLLPLPMVWQLQVSVRRRIELTGLFMLGAFACVASAIRIVHLKNALPSDITYTISGGVMWGSIEQTVGIICACLPTLLPLFRSRGGESKRQGDSYGNSSRSAGDSRAKGRNGLQSREPWDPDSESVMELALDPMKHSAAASVAITGDNQSDEEVRSLHPSSPPATGIMQIREIRQHTTSVGKGAHRQRM